MTVVSFLRMGLFTKRDSELMEQAARLLRRQGQSLQAARDEALHWQMLTLLSQRAARDVATSWLESLRIGEDPDIEDMEMMVCSLNDAVAFLEEHFEGE
jgi:hypothetical protein